MKAGPCTINVINPKGRATNLKTKQVPDGFETVFSPWDSGLHKVKVEYVGKEIPGSPFEVEVFKINLNAIVVTGLETRKWRSSFQTLNLFWTILRRFYILVGFFSVWLLSVLRGLSVFSSPPQRPMTSDFEGFYPLHLFSYLNSLERASIFPFECSVLNKVTTGTIFIIYNL